MIALKHMMLLGGLVISPLLLSAQEYFQQRVDHVIQVRLDDAEHKLFGEQEITYTNNSPQALDTIWIHLWPNAYRDRSTALNRQLAGMGDLSLHFATEEQRGWIDSLSFRSGDQDLKWGYHPEHVDIGWLVLQQPLQPGGTTIIRNAFTVKVPSSRFSRLGHTKQAYHITQWFPKPAVYDVEGWHAMPYLTQGEFYSEFGSYDVSITLPRNYVVGATGLLQNAEERHWLDSLASARLDDQKFKAPFQREKLNEFPPSDAATKTIRFVQENVHDFAWFADKRFIVRKGNVGLESGRSVQTWTMFTPRNAPTWENAIEYVNESVRLYSKWVGEYPYDACTAIDGTISAGGGMEYPMITIIGNTDDKKALDNVIAHEVGHNWFYGILGSNERDHPWMDEGMNSFVELRYMRERFPDSTSVIADGIPEFFLGRKLDHRAVQELAYHFNARRNLDQPIECHSTCFTSLNYGTIVYMKTALVFDHLLAYLGEETFDRCMHAYYNEWKFRHPQPKDVRAVFERESGMDLSWIFDRAIGSTDKYDVKAIKLRTVDSDVPARPASLVYRSHGLKSAHFPVTGFHGNDSLGTIWIRSSGSGVKEEENLPWPNVDRVLVDADHRTVDIDRRNNEVVAGGLLANLQLPRLRFLMGVEDPSRRSVFWSPLIARNGHDGWHFGIGLNNFSLPSQRTEWLVAPMYAVGSEKLIGGARIEHHLDRLNSRIFQNVGLALNVRTASTFHSEQITQRYLKVAPSIEFIFKRDPLSRPWEHKLLARAIFLDFGSTIVPLDGTIFNYGFSAGPYGELSYTAGNNSALLPTFIKPVITGSMDFLRGSLEISQGFSYNRKKDQLRLRAFAGTFLWKDQAWLVTPIEAWQLSWGPQNMLFDHVYLERGAYDNDFRGRQFYKQQGAFKTPFTARSDQWIAAINAELDLPIPIPFSLFASGGMVPSRLVIGQDDGTTEIRSITSHYLEAGIGLQLWKDVVEVWFPLIVSQEIEDEEVFRGAEMTDRIRFVVAFERFDPTRLLRNLRP
jgi:hypothetical protein